MSNRLSDDLLLCITIAMFFLGILTQGGHAEELPLVLQSCELTHNAGETSASLEIRFRAQEEAYIVLHGNEDVRVPFWNVIDYGVVEAWMAGLRTSEFAVEMLDPYYVPYTLRLVEKGEEFSIKIAVPLIIQDCGMHPLPPYLAVGLWEVLKIELYLGVIGGESVEGIIDNAWFYYDKDVGMWRSGVANSAELLVTHQELLHFTIETSAETILFEFKAACTAEVSH